MLGAWSFASASAAKPVLSDLACYPPSITLGTAKSRQAIVVQATYADGLTRDVTAQARYKLGDAKLVRLEKAALSPLADGKTELRVSFEGRTLNIPVTISNTAL